MTSILASLLAAAFTTLGTSVDVDPAAALHYSVQFDETTGSTSLTCQESSTGSCTFWIGDGLGVASVATGRGTLSVGSAPAIVRVAAVHPAYCVGVSEQAPPKWPECTHGPLGGALDRSATVNYDRL